MTALPALPPTPIGLLAGGGSLPVEIARSIMRRGGRVHVVAIAGEADQDWTGVPHTEVGWGSIGGMIGALRSADCRDLIIIGRVKRPNLWRMRPDLGFFQHMPRLLRLVSAGGDDSLLRRVIRFVEDLGFRVRGPGELAPDLLANSGAIGTHAPDPRLARDIALGFAVVNALGPFDIGQAVIVAGGRLVAVEGAEGTDGLLARLPAYGGVRAPATARLGILVKCPKPGQELRVDMPVIGPHTVTLAETKGLHGIAVAAGSVLLADRGEMIRRADAAGLFVAGFADGASPELTDGSAMPEHTTAPLTACVGRPGPHDLADALLGGSVLGALMAYARHASVIVARQHVLAVGIDESPDSFAVRVGRLKQWGDNGLWRRRGVLALSDAGQLDMPCLESAARARLAGVAMARGAMASPYLLEAARRLGLFIVAPAVESGG